MAREIRRLAFLFVIVAVASAGFLHSTPGVSADGIGIYPTSLRFEDGLRGGEYFRTVGVINTGETSREFAFDADGDIARWIDFVSPGNRQEVISAFTASAGAEARAMLKLRIPEDTANGSYSGVVRVMANAGEASGQGAGAGVTLGAEIPIEVMVSGTQSISGSLLDVRSANAIEKASLLRLKSTVRNSGNVRVSPEVSIEVLDGDGNSIAVEKFNGNTNVFPGEVGLIASEWDSSLLDTGDYQARVNVRFEDMEIGTRNIGFSVLPAGTLTRQGELRRMDLAVVPGPGELAKLNVIFRNTGQIDTKAKFVGEMYFNEKLLDVVNSEEFLVPTGEQATLVTFARVGEEGAYSIKGKVNFEGKETDLKEVSFDVFSLPSPLESQEPGADVQKADEGEASLQIAEDTQRQQPVMETPSGSGPGLPILLLAAMGIIGVAGSVAITVFIMSRRNPSGTKA